MLGKTQSKEVNSKYPSRNSVGYPHKRCTKVGVL